VGNENRPTFPPFSATPYTEKQVHHINLACAEHVSFKVTDTVVCRAYILIIYSLNVDLCGGVQSVLVMKMKVQNEKRWM